VVRDKCHLLFNSQYIPRTITKKKGSKVFVPTVRRYNVVTLCVGDRENNMYSTTCTQVLVINYLYSPIPLYILYNIKGIQHLSVPLLDNERTNNKNASISTKTIFKSVYKTLFNKLNCLLDHVTTYIRDMAIQSPKNT